MSLLSRSVRTNKFGQSNLRRWPRRCESLHVRRKVPIGYNGAPQIRPQKYPSRGRIAKPHYLPHAQTRPTYDSKRHPDPIRRFSTMYWTDRRTNAQTDTPTHRPTDRPRKGLMTIAHYASNVSDAAYKHCIVSTHISTVPESTVE